MESSPQKQHRRWRLSRSELAGHKVIIPDETWCPLDGPPPAYIPDSWTGPHVGLRLVDAFRTLANLPGDGHRSASGYWPPYLLEYQDELAREQSDDDLKSERADETNRVRILPTAKDISHMLDAIAWPGHYIREASISRVVQRVALYKSRNLDNHVAAKRLGLRPRKLREVNRFGLDLIARGLRHDRARVF